MSPVEALVPVIVSVAFFAIPIVAILVKHQQRMAQLIHGDPGRRPVLDPMMQQQIAELRQMVAQQAIALDSLAESNRRLTAQLASQSAPPEVPLQQRVG